MSDETVPMLHIPDDWDTFATIHNYIASAHALTMSARDISAGIIDRSRRAGCGHHPQGGHTVGYGGAGWYLLHCDECGAKEIA